MKKLSTLILSMLTILGLGVTMLAPVPAFATASDEVQKGTCEAGGGQWVNNSCSGGNADTSKANLNNTIHTVISTMLFIVGILSVIMIIYSGIRYIISRGEQGEVKSAKDTLMYSVVGLIVAILAFVIVNWVFSSIK